VQRLSQEEGVSLAGIQRILELEHQVDALRARVQELAEELDRVRDASYQPGSRVFAVGPAGEIIAMRAGQRPRANRSQALVVWQPHF
jgi:MerR family transcriptional regulator/heat shock protein HspR